MINRQFLWFLDRLSRVSGQKTLCEAIEEGYKVCCEGSAAIFENAEGSAQHKTRRVIREVLPKYSGHFDDVATDDKGKPILTQRGNEQTVLQYLEGQLRDRYFHDGRSNIKFEPGIARIAFGELGFQRREDTHRLTQLGKILVEISQAHSGEYDYDLNGMTFDALQERFGGVVKAASDAEMEEIENAEYGGSDYTIEWIPDFETAEKYYSYTNPNSRWCITHMKDVWDSYTSNGMNRVYFCHRPGFERLKPVKGENCPLDEYGLSLICVIMTPEKELRTVTCRWNHDNGGSDAVMDARQLSGILGRSVFSACPPFSDDELIKMGKTPLHLVQKMLDEGKKVEFDTYKQLENGIAKVGLNGKYNFIDSEGKLLSDKWYDGAYWFSEGKARVGLNGKWNFIDSDGKLICDKWFDIVYDFHEGKAAVKLNEKWNFIDSDGNLLSDTWFDYVDNFHDGKARVGLNENWNFIDSDGKLLCGKWFVYADEFHEGKAMVKLKGKWNFIDTDGNLLSDKLFDSARGFHDGQAKVKLNGKWNFIDTDGNLLSDKWFD